MEKNKSALYAAFMAKDARFDGRFFVGISSTGIYCRPVCRAKQPRAENCTFFSSAAEAEKAGYRPCLLCRPELAPGAAIVDASKMLAQKASRLFEEECGNGLGLEDYANILGCSDRHLRRVFENEYHVTPVQYLQTCRLLLAKNLLTDTDISVMDVAMAAGFGSLRRLNDLFKKQYKLSPTALRKHTAEGKLHPGDISVALGYRPPYLWDKMLKFLEERSIYGVEAVKGNQYMRTVQFHNKSGEMFRGWIRVCNQSEKNVLKVTVSESLIPVLSQVLARVKRLFDLYCDPDIIYETLQVMNQLRPDLCVKGTRVPGGFDSFEVAVRAILGQQIHVKAASTLARRIAQTYGRPMDTGIEGLTHTFPTVEDILSMNDQIIELFGSLGVTSVRSGIIRELADAMANGKIKLDMCSDPEEEMGKLMAIKGVGKWTSQYIVMRAMGWTDAFLETDAGVKRVLQPYKSGETLKIAEAWKPWRSYATVNIWNTLQEG